MTVRAAIYCRISLDKDGKEEGVERQEAECRKWAETHGWEVIEPPYVDNSISAYDPHKRRPAYEQLVSDVKAGAVRAVLVWDIDRLTRQPKQLYDWIDMADPTKSRHPVMLVEAKDYGERVDMRSPMGQMILGIRASISKYEVAHKGERQRAANRARALKGTYFGGKRPVGYTFDAEVIPHEAAVVRAIFDAYLAGANLKEIARALGGEKTDLTEGVPTTPRPLYTEVKEYNERHPDRMKPMPAPQPWTGARVMSILRNPRYAGIMSYGPSNSEALNEKTNWYPTTFTDEDGRIVHGTWKPIVDEDTWHRAQALMEDHRSRRKQATTRVRRHLGTGLFLCGVCGKPIATTGLSYGCKGHVCRQLDGIDRYVTEVIARRLDRADARRGIKAGRKGPVRDFDAEIEKQRKRIKRAEADYDAEVIEAADLARVRDKARAEISRIEAERDTSPVSTIPASVFRADSPSQAFMDLPVAGKQAVIDVLATVTVLPGSFKRGQFDPSRAVRIDWK